MSCFFFAMLPIVVFIFFHFHVLLYWYIMEIWQSQCMQGDYAMFNLYFSMRKSFNSSLEQAVWDSSVN